MCFCEQSLSRGSSQSAVRSRWLSLCTVWPSHSQWPSEQISFFATMRPPILQQSCSFFFFSKASRQPGLSPSLQSRFGSLRLLTSPKAKIAVEREEICECDGYTLHTLSQRRPPADWLAPRESDCSWACERHNEMLIFEDKNCCRFEELFY